VLLTPDERIASVGYDYETQEKEPIEECDLCEGRSFTVVAHKDRYGFAAEAHACSHCGLVFLNPRMSAGAYGDFYRDTYRPLVSAYHGRMIDAASIEDEQRQYAERLIRFLEPFVRDRRPRTLLDVGGSTGVIAAALAESFAVDATVLDPAPAEIERAKKRGLRAEIGTLESLAPSDVRYGMITLCQTIDHLLEMRSSLARIKEALEPDGLVFIDIVDFRAAYLRERSIERAVKIDHPYYLTQTTAEAYLARAGLRWLRKDYAPDHLHVGYACEESRADPAALPRRREVEFLFQEIRQVQNLPGPR
jgi:2-polyprenyl-3-methyl-5-hydroxy-6-metoxy-1,4-benzoquinol methylase